MFDKLVETSVNKPFQKPQVDELSVIAVPEKLDYQLLLTEQTIETRSET
ncbi:hypothetical protein [Robertmurraya siralis]|nr:hypothetical protein [Robertmurraya siralis]